MSQAQTQAPFSLIRLLLLAVFGNHFLKFEGMQFLKEQQFMLQLNVEVSKDSLKEKQDELKTEQGVLNTNSLVKDDQMKQADKVNEIKETCAQIEAALVNNNIQLENLNYKKEILNRI